MLTAVFLLVTCIVFARLRPTYSHWEHTISELGAVDSPHGHLVSYGVFLPVGVSLALVALLSVAAHPPIAALAAAISVGYVVGAVFPCDAGSPMIGSTRQQLHNLGGAAEYLGGTLSLFAIAEDYGPLFRVAGFVVGVSTVVLIFESPVRGLAQRIAEACLFIGLAFALATCR